MQEREARIIKLEWDGVKDVHAAVYRKGKKQDGFKDGNAAMITRVRDDTRPLSWTAESRHKSRRYLKTVASYPPNVHHIF